MQACGCVYGCSIASKFMGVVRGVRQGKRPRGKGAVQDTPTTLRPSRREVAH
jgi:hypothetical protein